MHEAPAIVGSGEGSMYATLPLHAERLFPGFEPVTSRSLDIFKNVVYWERV